jgi:hypothetical protein
VNGVVEPAGRVEVVLIISGHHDSAPVARIFSGPFQRYYQEVYRVDPATRCPSRYGFSLRSHV